MRFLWCLSYMGAAMCLFVVLSQKNPYPCTMWPILTMQSVYCIGVLILSLSSIPKVIRAFLGEGEYPGTIIGLLTVFLLWAGMNFFLNYILWHFYWFTEANYKHYKSTQLRRSVTNDEEMKVFSLNCEAIEA